MKNAKSSTPKDDASAVSGMGNRALQFILTQSTNGEEDKHEAQPVKKRGGRKKTPQKIKSVPHDSIFIGPAHVWL